MAFPVTRLRRLRRTDALRGMVRETRVAAADLIQPLFVRAGSGPATPIPSLAGQYHHSIETLVEEGARVHEAGVPAVILFGLPDHKDEAASSAYDDEGIVQMALRALRAQVPELVLITDVCLCQYTSHGHCGVLRDGGVDNDLTLELLAQTAVSHAAAGADIVAPSDMMDGRVAAIRSALDADGLSTTAILAYSAKFASAFYGPFRDAAHSAPSEGDRRGYQMDPANGNEALREVLLDIEEGADMVMVKPAMPYLDVISRVREATLAPIAAYQVSGEYAMLTGAAEKGLLDERTAALEALTGIKRAGADMIITYHATRAASEWLS
ncbi:MAG TPA: porphobilinogen synthase [Gaiellales bacterium]|nr:porphobilinogen synthase [Gaiellales bacterium]